MQDLIARMNAVCDAQRLDGAGKGQKREMGDEEEDDRTLLGLWLLLAHDGAPLSLLPFPCFAGMLRLNSSAR